MLGSAGGVYSGLVDLVLQWSRDWSRERRKVRSRTRGWNSSSSLAVHRCTNISRSRLLNNRAVMVSVKIMGIWVKLHEVGPWA